MMHHFRTLNKLTNLNCSAVKRFSFNRPMRDRRVLNSANSNMISIRNVPKSIENHFERQEGKYSDAFYSGCYAIAGAVVGGLLPAVVRYGIDYREEQKRLESMTLKIDESFKRSLRNLIHCRNHFILRSGRNTVRASLSQARTDAVNAFEELNKMNVKERKRFEENKGYSLDSIDHLIACIDYHTGVLCIQDYNIEMGKEKLSESLAKRVMLQDSDCLHPTNEIHRTNIKLADAASQTRHIDTAVHMYESINEHGNDAILNTFWKIKALNNLSIVYFAVGTDGMALEKMKEVAQLTRQELHKLFKKSIAATADFTKVKEDIAYLHRTMNGVKFPSRKLSENLKCLIELGKLNSVDVAHLPYAKAMVDEEDSKNRMDKVFEDRDVACFAIECLERIRLLLRKENSSNWNCVIMQSYPFTNYVSADGDIIDSLHDMLKEPEHFNLYKELDNGWLQQEGNLRMMTALASGLITLLEEGKKQYSDNDWTDWTDYLEDLTSRLITTSAPFTFQAPTLHQQNAVFVRSRFLSICNKKEEELYYLRQICEWTKIEQQKARRDMQEHVSSGKVWPKVGVPPRHARLQISAIVLYFHNTHQSKWSEEDISMLKFAMSTLHLDKKEHTLYLESNRILEAYSSLQNRSWYTQPPMFKVEQSCRNSDAKRDFAEYSKVLLQAKAMEKMWTTNDSNCS